MDNLRWILLGIGSFIILGFYIFARVQKYRRREPVPTYEQVDWEQDSVQGLRELPADEFEEFDDLPSMDALEAARVQHAAEGGQFTSVAASETKIVEECHDDETELSVNASLVTDTTTNTASTLESAAEAVSSEEDVIPINSQLRDVWLKNAEPQEPVMGSSISADDIVEPSLNMNADKLKTGIFGEDEPQLVLSDIAVADALVRMREENSNRKEKLQTKPAQETPQQDTFGFDDQESIRQQNEKLKAEANQRLIDEKRRQEKVRKTAQQVVDVKSELTPASKPQSELNTEARFDQATEQQASIEAAQEEVVVLHVKAKDSIGFYGPEMAQCFADIGIKFGEMGIYHYHTGGQRILSVANMVKPGTFDPDNMNGFTTPGVSLFLQLRPQSDFDLSEQVLVKSAQYIAYKLKGEVLNAKRVPLDNVKQAELSREIADIRSALTA